MKVMELCLKVFVGRFQPILLASEMSLPSFFVVS